MGFMPNGLMGLWPILGGEGPHMQISYFRSKCADLSQNSLHFHDLFVVVAKSCRRNLCTFWANTLFNSYTAIITIRLYNNTSLMLKKGPTSPNGRVVGLSKMPSLKKLFTVKVDQNVH